MAITERLYHGYQTAITERLYHGYQTATTKRLYHGYQSAITERLYPGYHSTERSQFSRSCVKCGQHIGSNSPFPFKPWRVIKRLMKGY